MANPNDKLAEMVKRMAELEAQNAQLKASLNSKGRLSYKVSEKGACSVYGMGRFPVTLYKEQWEKILADAGLKAFLSDVANHFSTKADHDAAKAGPKAGTTAPNTGSAV